MRPEPGEAYTLTGKGVEVRVRESGQGRLILDVSKLPAKP
jgi:hypothetical protein